jgi:hypothetical protein
MVKETSSNARVVNQQFNEVAASVLQSQRTLESKVPSYEVIFGE